MDTIIFRGYVSFREGVGRILQIIDFRYLVDQPVTYLLIRALVEFQSSLPAMSSACPAYFFGTSSSIHGVVVGVADRSGSAAETPKKDTKNQFKVTKVSRIFQGYSLLALLNLLKQLLSKDRT